MNMRGVIEDEFGYGDSVPTSVSGMFYLLCRRALLNIVQKHHIDTTR